MLAKKRFVRRDVIDPVIVFYVHVQGSVESERSKPADHLEEPSPKLKHDGYGEGYHPAADHPIAASASPRTGVGHASADDSGPEIVRGSGGGDDGNAVATGKPKFIDRVRGEAKVFVGKMGGNEEKIEEGRRMMGKTYRGEAGVGG